jgi:two-component system, NtrC family, sensor kinase
VRGDGAIISNDVSGECEEEPMCAQATQVPPIDDELRRGLRVAEGRLRSLMGIPRLGLLIVDPGHRITIANRRAAELTGYSSAQMQEMDFLSLLSNPDREAVAKMLSQDGGAEGLDVTVVTGEGRTRAVGLSCSGCDEINGSRASWVALWDLEPYKEMERAAEEAQEKARNIAETGDVGILVYDQDFRILFANQTAAEMTGCPVDELIGSEVNRFLGRVNRIYLKSRSGGTIAVAPGSLGSTSGIYLKGLNSSLSLEESRRKRMEMELHRADGQIKLVEVCLSMSSSAGGRSETHAYLMDLTDRIQIENELRKTNEFFKNVIRSSVDGIIAADMKGNIIIFNEGAERLLGYRAEEVIGKVHITQLYPPGVAKRIMRRLRSESYGPRGKLPTTPTALVAKTGEQIPVRASAAIVYEGKQEIASVGIFRDLRERLKMQQQLEDTYKQLLHSEKLASLGKLAAGVAHEINNPLGGIMMYANMLLEQTGEGPAANDLREIVEQAVRCKEIVQGLLDFSRKRGEEKARADLNLVIEKSIALMKKQAMFVNVRIQRNMDPELPTIHGDPDQMTQVITNLIVNAADAMEGKGTLGIRTWSDGSPPEVHVEISDTGKGIPDQNLSRIFDPFFTTKDVGKGTGLGLSIAYGIVRRRGGEIQVRSKVGEGTTFHLRLPLEQAAGHQSQLDDGVAGIRDKDGRTLHVGLVGERGLMRLLSFYESFEPKGAFEGLPPKRRRDRRRWVMGLVGGWRNFLILDGDRVAGHLGVSLGESDLEEVILFVHQDYRGKGIGTQALRHIRTLLEQAGCRRLWLTVENTNMPAIRCFQKAGFRFTSDPMERELEMVMEMEE